MRPRVKSATVSPFEPGVVVTATPCSAAASTSTLSKPTPVRAMTFRPSPAASMTSRETTSEPLAMIAVEPGASDRKSSADRGGSAALTTTSQPASVNLCMNLGIQISAIGRPIRTLGNWLPFAVREARPPSLSTGRDRVNGSCGALSGPLPTFAGPWGPFGTLSDGR